jgi:FkbM family methyltransferase
MSWGRFRHLVGRTISASIKGILSNRALPLMRATPYGLSAWYDAQRIYGSRDFGVIFDVGANVGQTAVELVQFFPRASIHCFEPASEPFQSLKTRARPWANVTVHRLALGDEVAERPMRVATGIASEQNTLVLAADAAHGSEAAETVTVETLDNFCVRHEVARLNLLKMDVQGWELNVLRGGRALLNEGRIDFILTEAAFDIDNGSMVNFCDIHKELHCAGFVVSGFYDFFRWGNKSEMYFCNVLYSRKPIAEGHRGGLRG